jgi:hypothetical protein
MDNLIAPTTIPALAAHFIALAEPIRFRVAQSPSEQEAAYRLRYQAVVEQGWVPPERLDHGLEQDAYDPVALHIVGWESETPVCTARLVFPRPGQQLPTEAAFQCRIAPESQVVDVGRFTISRPYRHVEPRMFAGLVGQCWQEVQSRGFLYACGNGQLSILRLYRRFGIVCQVVAPSRVYWGKEHYPFRIELVSSAQSLARRWLSADQDEAGRDLFCP